MKRHRRIALGVIGVLCLLTTPQFLSAVHTNILVELAISATFAVSVNLLLSYAGLLSFGHALFFGSGAYATALALTHIEGLGPITALLLGGLAGFLVAALCSPFLGRISGTAFAMLSLALGQLMYVMCLKYREVTGGEDGIAGFPIPPLVVPGILRVELTNPTNFFYFAIIVLGASIGLMWHLTRTPFSSLVIAIGNNAERIGYLGVHVLQGRSGESGNHRRFSSKKVNKVLTCDPKLPVMPDGRLMMVAGGTVYDATGHHTGFVLRGQEP